MSKVEACPLLGPNFYAHYLDYHKLTYFTDKMSEEVNNYEKNIANKYNLKGLGYTNLKPGDIVEIYDYPRNEYSFLFVLETNIIDKDVVEILFDEPYERYTGVYFHNGLKLSNPNISILSVNKYENNKVVYLKDYK